MSQPMACGRRPRRYDAFLLDLYGTLADIHPDENQPSLWKRLAGFAVSKGAPWEPEALRRAYLDEVRREEERLRLRDREIPGALPEIDLAPVFAALYAARGVSADDKLIAETARLFRSASTTHLRLYAGSKELLADLRRRGKLILLSNAQSLFTRPELEALGLSEAFDAVYISSEAGCRKPDPRFFRLALEREGLEPGRCLMIGNDPLCDGWGARSVGMDAWVIRSALSPRELSEGYDQEGMDLRKLQRLLTRQAVEMKK